MLTSDTSMSGGARFRRLRSPSPRRGQPTAAPPSSVMNSRRRMSGFPSAVGCRSVTPHFIKMLRPAQSSFGSLGLGSSRASKGSLAGKANRKRKYRGTINSGRPSLPMSKRPLPRKFTSAKIVSSPLYVATGSNGPKLAEAREQLRHPSRPWQTARCQRAVGHSRDTARWRYVPSSIADALNARGISTPSGGQSYAKSVSSVDHFI